MGKDAAARLAAIKNPEIVKWYNWFAKQKPRPSSPLSMPNLPGMPDDLTKLPDMPNLPAAPEGGPVSPRRTYRIRNSPHDSSSRPTDATHRDPADAAGCPESRNEYEAWRTREASGSGSGSESAVGNQPTRSSESRPRSSANPNPSAPK